MPTIVFTFNEILDSHLRKMRSLSASITELGDLTAKPLNPGESPDSRRHKIAKLGKELAETFTSFDLVMADWVERAAAMIGPNGERLPPSEPPNSAGTN